MQYSILNCLTVTLQLCREPPFAEYVGCSRQTQPHFAASLLLRDYRRLACVEGLALTCYEHGRHLLVLQCDRLFSHCYWQYCIVTYTLLEYIFEKADT